MRWGPSLSDLPFTTELEYDQDGTAWRFLDDRVYRGTQEVFKAPSGIRVLRLDDMGNVWIGTVDHGLIRLTLSTFRMLPQHERLPAATILSLLEDEDGTVWIGTALGLVTYRADSLSGFDLHKGYRGRAPTYFPRKGYARAQKPGDAVWGLYQDNTGTVWVGTNYEHCYVAGNRCIIPNTPGVPQDLYENVAAMHQDQQGRLWFGSKWGLILAEPAGTDTLWTHFSTETGMTHNWVQFIHETPGGRLIVGTNGGGLMRFANDGFEPLTMDQGLSSNNLVDVHEDTDGSLWIGTSDRGLCHVAYTDEVPFSDTEVACLTAAQGLYDNTINRILEDDQGRFWMSTSRGIFWAKKEELRAALGNEARTISSIAYTEQDGLLTRQTTGGKQHAGIKTADGELWFATRNGVAIVDPSRVQTRSGTIPLRVENIRVGEQQYLPNAMVTLDGKERSFEIDYTALEFTRPQDVRIRHRLDGFEKIWHEAGLERRATYTNVPPGTYTFYLSARRGGAWQEEEVALTIKRLPYFWETRWFFGLVLVLAVVLVAGLVRFRTHRILVRNRALEQTVTERTAKVQQQAEQLRRANTLKSRFLANISHEFRTPLTLTLGPLTDMKKGRYGVLPQPVTRELDRATRNAQRLLGLINQLLDLSKLEAGSLALQIERRDLVRFVRQMTALFESLADSHSITYRFESALETLPFGFDADKLEKVIVNLLSNSFKFTPEGGHITVRLHQKATGDAVIEVHDTGVGIAPEQVPHVFDRFYQVDGTATRQHEGTGIGLSLVEELITLHRGTITVASTVGVGTTFTISLPDANAPLAPPGDGASSDGALPPPLARSPRGARADRVGGRALGGRVPFGGARRGLGRGYVGPHR
ncbi:MAG: hypothetical protein RhofKO_40360 [Rhodothermales bacterium]